MRIEATMHNLGSRVKVPIHHVWSRAIKSASQNSRKQITQLLLTIQQQCNTYKINPCETNEIALTKSTASLISSHLNGTGAIIAAQIITKRKDFVNFMSVLAIVLHIQCHKHDIDSFWDDELGKRILVMIKFVYGAHGFSDKIVYQFVKYQGNESIAYILSSLHTFDTLPNCILQPYDILSSIITILSFMPMKLKYADSSRSVIHRVCMPHLTRILQSFADAAPLTARVYFDTKNQGILQQTHRATMDHYQHQMYMVLSSVCDLWKHSFDASGDRYELDILLKKLLQSSQNILESNYQPFANDAMKILLYMMKDNKPSRAKTVKLSTLSYSY